jgi:CHASE2 domain-containing sensor protein
MPEKDPSVWTAFTWCMMIGACFLGGVTSWYKRVKEGHTRAFNIIELIGETCTCCLCGYVGFVAALYFFDDLSVSIAACCISAHFSTRLLFSAEGVIDAAAKMAIQKMERMTK